MKLPRVLLVDDQFARSATERALFLGMAGLIEAGTPSAVPLNAVAEVVVCAGQRRAGDRLFNDPQVVIEAVSKGDWALLLLDMQFDSGDLDAHGRPAGQAGDEWFGKTILEHLNTQFPKLPVVMLTGKRHSELGDIGVPFLSKLQMTPYTMRRTLLRFGDLPAADAQAVLGLGQGVVAQGPATIAAFRQAFIHAGSDVSILVLGESGVGKEVLAKFIHQSSARVSMPFVAVNVAAMPKDLVESELFGIGKRVATDVAQRNGKFEQASGGTLFLDEVGDMPLETQAKVLRALQERKIQRVGETAELGVDIRLVCATSKNLGLLVETGAFRSDLLFRINSVPITIPPLRDRPEDIAPLATAFLADAAQAHGKTGLSFDATALRLLEGHPFPGNVRELKNLVERLSSSAGLHQILGPEEFHEALGATVSPGSTQGGREPAAQNIRPTKGSASFSTEASSLAECLALLGQVSFDRNDPALRGVMPRLEAAVRLLLQRLAGAALARYRDPDDHALNRQRAMQFLTGDAALKGKGPSRVINEILGRRQETPVTDEDLEQLVDLWLAGRENESSF